MSNYKMVIRSLFLRLLKEIFLIGVMVIAFSPVCYGFQWKSIEIIPSVSSETEYNDNIYYDPTDEEAEWDIINRIYPGLVIRAPVPSLRWDFELAYAAAFEIFSEHYDDLNDVAHEATGKVRIQPVKNIIFTCEDSFFRGRDFGEIDELGLRRQRELYWMNTAISSLEYTFGPNRILSLSYENNMLDYDNRALPDARENIVNPVFTYGIGRNILTLDYIYTQGDYGTDMQDLDGHAVELGYEYLLNPRTSILANGRYLLRNFSGTMEDYYLYAFLVGLRRDLIAALSIEAQGGYLRYEAEEMEADNSFIGILTITYESERMTFNFIADMGYEEIFLAVEHLGYARAWGVTGSFAYNLHRFWSVELTGTYRNRDYDYEERLDDYWTAGCALIFEPVEWFSASVNYEHTTLDSTIYINNYDVNRVMLLLQLSY